MDDAHQSMVSDLKHINRYYNDLIAKYNRYYTELHIY